MNTIQSRWAVLPVALSLLLIVAAGVYQGRQRTLDARQLAGLERRCHDLHERIDANLAQLARLLARRLHASGEAGYLLDSLEADLAALDAALRERMKARGVEDVEMLKEHEQARQAVAEMRAD